MSKTDLLRSSLIEGLTKKLNKAKKKDLEGSTVKDIQANRKASKENVTKNSKAAEAHATLDGAGAIRRTMGSKGKTGAKLFLKASKNASKSANESMNKIALLLVDKYTESLCESIFGKTDKDSIKNAGGDADTYEKIKASKEAKTTSSKKRVSRTSALGRFGGMYDKSGKKYNPEVKSSSNFKKGAKSKPMPLNPKGNPGKGKDPAGARGKTINTSRADANKIQAKTDASDSVANKLFTALSKKK